VAIDEAAPALAERKPKDLAKIGRRLSARIQGLVLAKKERTADKATKEEEILSVAEVAKVEPVIAAAPDASTSEPANAAAFEETAKPVQTTVAISIGIPAAIEPTPDSTAVTPSNSQTAATIEKPMAA